MDIDPLAAAGLTTREVRTGTRDGESTRIAVARRTYATDRADLWDALTNPERLPRWFLPISGDLRVGGRYQLEGNAGGVVERCDEPESFGVTWEMRGAVSWLAVSLDPADRGTVLELTHEAPVEPEFWSQFGPGAVGLGWDLALVGLDRYVETGVGLDPEQVNPWSVSPDGVAFFERASTDWADAAIADGDDPEAARQASQRALAFYTTIPEGGPGE